MFNGSTRNGIYNCSAKLSVQQNCHFTISMNIITHLNQIYIFQLFAILRAEDTVWELEQQLTVNNCNQISSFVKALN